MDTSLNPSSPDRRQFLRTGVRSVALACLGGVSALLTWRRRAVGSQAWCRDSCGSCADKRKCGLSGPCRAPSGYSHDTVWQLDPEKCMQCGRCATNCVLTQSAVRCFHTHAMCGYCKLCFGYFQPDAAALSTAAENQLCPTGAIRRKFVEDPYYEYTIDHDLCIGCGKCVKGCNTFGNGSLYLQISHDICLNCNECSIARHCPADAFHRVPADRPYLLKGREVLRNEER